MKTSLVKFFVKLNPFSIVTFVLCVFCLGSSGFALFADEPLKNAAFVVACLCWLSLPLAIYQELFYYRYRSLSRWFQTGQH